MDSSTNANNPFRLYLTPSLARGLYEFARCDDEIHMSAPTTEVCQIGRFKGSDSYRKSWPLPSGLLEPGYRLINVKHSHRQHDIGRDLPDCSGDTPQPELPSSQRAIDSMDRKLTIGSQVIIRIVEPVALSQTKRNIPSKLGQIATQIHDNSVRASAGLVTTAENQESFHCSIDFLASR
jgi:hypothetical protein